MASSSSTSKLDENKLTELAQQYLKWDNSQEIATLLKEKNFKQLETRLGKRIAFGTAGLRGEMKAGFAFMNRLTVLQASQGLCAYLKQIYDKLEKKETTLSICIGYDGRHNSLEFAHITAAVFLSKGFKVYLFRRLVPTPFVPFCVLQRQAMGGIMITASHNPKQDNGYKVYWRNGAQIVSPHDKGIAQCIEENLEPWSLDTHLATVRGEGNPSDLLIDPTTDVPEAYYKMVAERYSFFLEKNAQRSSNFPIVFTPMHGVGNPWVQKVFDCFNLKQFIPVKEQMDPDPEFSTVQFPNPEEGAGALKLAIETAQRSNASLILANDPDSDRLAVAERNASTKQWKIFNGNEIGILLADWVFTQYMAHNDVSDRSKLLMMNTTVSSKMLKAMADKEGFHYEETLTGFKWIGSIAHRLVHEEGYHFLFGFEEAIGFLIGDICLDKDGVRAAAVFAEMANHYASLDSPKQLVDQLNALYEKYGYFETQNSYFFNYDPAVMYKIFEKMRGQDGKYTELIKAGAGRFKIKHVRDLMNGYDSQQPDNRAILPVSSSSPMTTFYFENGAVVTLRGSGTEPKLKYYSELSGSNKQQVSKELSELVQQAVIETFLQPEKNNLQSRKD
mmetsp:Transcript_4692/g.7048  ORF Transcript_4692/g.7048 Transcript_4692/m.7048 type:complete len:616 (+) Transcript_4692:886-2733(+)|eukprot:CAMPEP_0201546212 /NCGR_PEP_ID=MMETSP0173_2-20130828/2566_1 /ASSEMBLY_ACC=CAM_ASM_000268 /TAXON_ID=218659 /ORGANISM="Vexillifera sp., Strain DIVA3 564/2" /LENGTH=615 /DNA_ID=CAMNT_0047954819 /DNA_START=886 /DNA_END=2733 /DNA_ORIENTATION=-